MFDVPLFSQRDSAWSADRVGFSNYRISSQGCTLTALAAYLKFLGYDVNPRIVNNELIKLGEYGPKNPFGAYQGALLVWNNLWRAYPKLKAPVQRVKAYSNMRVSAWVYVTPRLPAFVEVNAASIGASKHWVLYLGDRKCLDPWTGNIVPTSKYPAIGYCLVGANR